MARGRSGPTKKPSKQGKGRKRQSVKQTTSEDLDESVKVFQNSQESSGSGRGKRCKTNEVSGERLKNSNAKEGNNINEDRDPEVVQFAEGDQIIEMTVEGQESEFASEDEVSDEDEEVILNISQNSQNSVNNNSVYHDERQGRMGDFQDPIEKQISADKMHDGKQSELSISSQDKDSIIGQAVGQAVAQVQEIIAKSGFIETASRLQKQLE